MENLENVVHERNDAVLRLETGDSAAPPMRRVTTKLGFTYERPAEEHYEPIEMAKNKEFEIPYLDKEAYITQKLWNEKQYLKGEIKKYDDYWHNEWSEDHETFKRGLRKHFKHVDHLPENVVKKRKAKEQQLIEQNL